MDRSKFRPDVQERVDRIQAELEKAGVRDLHFFWAPDAHKVDINKRAEDVCDLLEAVLEGRYGPLPKFNDSVRLPPRERLNILADCAIQAIQHVDKLFDQMYRTCAEMQAEEKRNGID